MLDLLWDSKLCASDRLKLKKTLLLLLIGELFGLHTLNQILTAHGDRSKRWYKSLNLFTLKQIERSIVTLLQTSLTTALEQLFSQSDSSWSRAAPVVVIDDSIFRQWLSKTPSGDRFSRYFSGQTKSTVSGFRVTLCGMSLGDTFYPAALRLTGKKEDSKQVACGLLEEVHDLAQQAAAKHGVTSAKLYLSVDNGFESALLKDKCEQLSEKMPIYPIFVPKSNAKIKVLDLEMTVGQAMAEFQILEEKYLEQQAKAGNTKPEAFTLRVHVWVKKLGAWSVMLLFRLKGSKKVSAIYTTDEHIKAKTLRRRWFARTNIEQFFRIIKDTVKIQQTMSCDSEGFERKLLIACLKALHCQLFRNYCRRLSKAFKKWGFARLRQHIIHQGIEKDWFKDLVFEKF